VTASELLRAVIRALDRAGIPHMLVGSFASSAYGEDRTTHDIDILIDPTPEALRRFVDTFDDEVFYIGPSPQDALTQQDMFNLIDTTSTWKVDFIILTDEPFERRKFERRVKTEVMDIEVWMATAEDTVLSKLRWAAEGGSDRQVDDAAGVLRVRGDTIDNAYLDRWAAELGLKELLDRARSA
jgi:hypothetical protein